ncbi:MAG: hypothetical protein AB7F38_04705 [Piscinibacter sp.]
MTILNLYVSPERAIMAVDTFLVEALPGGEYGRPLGHVAKLYCFERAGAVMACRGLARMGLYLRVCLGDGDNVQTLDAIDRAIPQAFALAQQKLLGELQSVNATWWSGPQAVRLVGWSHSRGRMVGVAFEQAAPGAALVRELIEDDTELAPWDDLQGDLPAGDSVEAMRQIALAQIDFQRQLHGERSTVGGDVQVADLTRDSVRIHLFPSADSRGTP